MTRPFRMPFVVPSESAPPKVAAAQEAMAATGAPAITLSARAYQVLYGYERECGRAVLVMVRQHTNTVNHIDIPVFGEIVEPGRMWHDGGPTDQLHEAMLAGAPGEMVTFDVDLGNHEYTDIVQRQLRRLSDAEMEALVGVDYLLPEGGPIRPFIRRKWGEDVPGPVHDCNICMWR